MAPFVRLWFEQGRLLVEGAGDLLGLSSRDPRSRCFVAAPAEYEPLLAAAARLNLPVDDEIAPLLAAPLARSSGPPPDPRLLDLLGALDACGGSGAIHLPSGKPRLDLLAILLGTAGTPALLICAGDNQVERWRGALSVESIPEEGVLDVRSLAEVMPSLHEIGHRFGLLVIDDAEHLLPGALRSVLRGLVAPRRVALLAPGSDALQGQGSALVGKLCAGFHRARVGALRADLIRLLLPLDSSEKHTFERILQDEASTPQERLAVLRVARRKREKLRELILRHRGRRMAVLCGEGTNFSEEDLLDGLSHGERGAFLSLLRTRTLWCGSIFDLSPTGGEGVEVIFVLGGPPDELIRGIFGAFSRRGTIYDLRVMDSPEDPCWRWPLWHGEHDEEDREKGARSDPILPGAGRSSLSGALRGQLGEGEKTAAPEGEALCRGTRDRPARGRAGGRALGQAFHRAGVDT